jgi:tetratricopeptide (TPR) repeat protein
MELTSFIPQTIQNEKTYIVTFIIFYMHGEEVPFIGRMEQTSTFLGMISEGSDNCLAIYGGPGIGKTRLLAEFHVKALQEKFNVISFSLNNFDDELSFMYHLGNGLQELLLHKNKQSQLFQFFGQWASVKKRKFETLSLGVASAVGGVISAPVGFSLSVASIIKALRDSAIQDERKIAFLKDLLYLLFQDLNELARQDQKLVILLDDGHRFRDSQVFQGLIEIILKSVPENVFIVIASRQKFHRLHIVEKELLEFSAGELQEVSKRAFAGIDADTLWEASLGHPYIVDRLYRMKTIPEFSIKDHGFEAIMDYVDAEFIQSLSEEELKFLIQISPIEEITYENAEAVTRESHVFVRRLMNILVSRSLLCFVGRRDFVSHEKIFKVHEIFRPTLLRSLENPELIHRVLADFYSSKMKKVSLHSHEAYYLRPCLTHLRQSCTEDYVGLVMEKVEEGDIFDLLGRYEEAVEFINKALMLCKDLKSKSFLELYKDYYLRMLGRTEEAKTLFQKVIDQFTEIGDDKGLALSYYEMGNILEMEGDQELAEKYYKDSMIISKKIGDIKIQGRNSFQMGMICFDRSEYKNALEYLDESIELCRRATDIESEINSIVLKAVIFEQFGSYDEAVNYARLALEMSRSNEYTEGEGDALDTLAGIECDRGHYLESLEYTRQLEEVYRRCGDPRGIMFSHIDKGRISLKFGKYSEALNEFEQALTIARAVQDAWLESMALNYIGTSFLDSGNYEKADEYFKESLEISERSKDPSGIGVSLHWMGVLSHEKEDSDDALEKLRKSVAISRDLGEKIGVADSMHWVGKAYEKQGAYDKALKIFEKNLRFYRKVNDLDGIADSIFMIGVVHRKTGHLLSSSRKMKISLQMYQKMGCEPYIAEALLEFARTKKLMGEEIEAMNLLQEAIKLAEKMKIKKLETGIHKELRDLQDARKNQPFSFKRFSDKFRRSTN